MLSSDVRNCIACSGVIHGPPLLDQPPPFIIASWSPSREASLFANDIILSQVGLIKRTGPAGIPWSTLNISAPPRPTLDIASRSAVMPLRVTFPFIQCHHVCGLAEDGGDLNSFSEGADHTTCIGKSAVDMKHAAANTRFRISLIRCLCIRASMLCQTWYINNSGRPHSIPLYGLLLLNLAAIAIIVG